MVERSSKRELLFKFKPSKVIKIIPSGNIKVGVKCPKGRSGHRIVVDSGDIYSFGGYNPNVEILDQQNEPSPLFKELWKFNLVSKTWTKLETKGLMPEELASHSAVLVVDKLMVFGGTGVPFGASSSNKLNICNLKTLEWNEVETEGQKPKKQYGQAIALYNGYLYVVGGTTGFQYSMDVHRLNLRTKVWEEMEARNKEGKPNERYRHEIAAFDEKLYIFGGGTATNSFGFKAIPVYDIKEQKWKITRTRRVDDSQIGFPLRRRCHSCVQSGSFVYLCGGHDGDVIFNDIWRIDLKTLQWAKLHQCLPRPVYFHSAALTTTGQMFVFGGVTNFTENTRTNTLLSVWLTIPPLKQIAWLAVQNYMPNLVEHSKESLLAIGLPISLLNTVDFYKKNINNPGNEDEAATP